MAVDLNKVAERLRSQRPVGVNRTGGVIDKDPRNDGSQNRSDGNTTLQPKRFFRL